MSCDLRDKGTLMAGEDDDSSITGSVGRLTWVSIRESLFSLGPAHQQLLYLAPALQEFLALALALAQSHQQLLVLTPLLEMLPKCRISSRDSILFNMELQS